MTPEIKLLMTQAAEATLRGDADAVEKANTALAELHRQRLERLMPANPAEAEK